MSFGTFYIFNIWIKKSFMLSDIWFMVYHIPKVTLQSGSLMKIKRIPIKEMRPIVED
mgnify:FL=1